MKIDREKYPVIHYLKDYIIMVFFTYLLIVINVAIVKIGDRTDFEFLSYFLQIIPAIFIFTFLHKFRLIELKNKTGST